MGMARTNFRGRRGLASYRKRDRLIALAAFEKDTVGMAGKSVVLAPGKIGRGSEGGEGMDLEGKKLWMEDRMLPRGTERMI